MSTPSRRNSFTHYVDELAQLLRQRPESAAATAALDGQVAKELRIRVPLAVRRAQGAFLTPRELARALASTRPTARGRYIDPAAGCGDLLLAAAAYLPLRSSLPTTLAAWGHILVGRDLQPEFVRAARLRVALLAASRLARSCRLDEDRIRELLPEITEGDGAKICALAGDVLLLNPPFGAVVRADVEWGQGRLNRAGVFTAEVIEAAEAGVHVAAILPDVLRTGSRHERWRAYIAERLRVEGIEHYGRFDPFTDVDVFVLRGQTSADGGAVRWWTRPEQDTRVSDRFEVNVGAVVPHRDPDTGPICPYVAAHDIPRAGQHRAGAITRRFAGRRFSGPFVAVRRTSSPSDRPRIVATLVVADAPVAVENHLIVCTPSDGKLATCRRLLEVLGHPETTEWIDQRIRCRHLTVAAVREIPWRDA